MIDLFLFQEGKLRGNNVWETHEHKKTQKAINV